jgi:hypothetical protein
MHTARMAKAYALGAPITRFPAGARKAVKAMAQMGAKKLGDFMHMAKKE